MTCIRADDSICAFRRQQRRQEESAGRGGVEERKASRHQLPAQAASSLQQHATNINLHSHPQHISHPLQIFRYAIAWHYPLTHLIPAHCGNVLPSKLDTGPHLLVSTGKHYSFDYRTDEGNRTNCSPLYVILFLTGNYILTRPCVYCPSYKVKSIRMPPSSHMIV